MMEFFYNNKRKRLDIGVLMEGLVNIDAKTSRGFVDVSENKDALHLARYFGGDVLKATANGLSIQDVINNLGTTEEYFMTFLVRRSVLIWLSLRSLRLWQACHSSSGYELKKIDK